MRLLAGLRDADRSLTRQAASRIPSQMGSVLSAVEEGAEGAKLWLGAATVMGTLGGGRGRRAAAEGLGAVVLAQVVFAGLCKRLVGRRRPPKEWIPHDEVEDPSFPSGHAAAAVGFTAAVAPSWPLAGALCAVPAALVAVERVQSGAHYPSDVAAGAAIGLISAWLTRHASHLLLRHRLQ